MRKIEMQNIYNVHVFNILRYVSRHRLIWYFRASFGIFSLINDQNVKNIYGFVSKDTKFYCLYVFLLQFESAIKNTSGYFLNI